MRRSLLLAAVAAALATTGHVHAQAPVVGARDAEALFTSSDPKLHRNKQAAYHIQRDLLEAGHWEMADQWLTERYIQHNPNAASGRAGRGGVLHQGAEGRAEADPAEAGAPVVAVLAEGDYVVGDHAARAEGPEGSTQDLHDDAGSTCGASSTARPTSTGTARRRGRAPNGASARAPPRSAPAVG